MPITPEQLDDLKAKVAKLSDDKGVADRATSASNQSHAVLTAAQADVAAKDAAEAQADGQVNVDLGDLRSYIDGLAAS